MNVQFEQALDLFATIIETEGGMTAEINNNNNNNTSNNTSNNSHATSILPSTADTHTASVGSLAAAVAGALNVHDLQRRAEVDGDTLAIAVNNLSICALYVKQIRTAITRLEQLVLLDPARHLTDPVVFNLCTLYDLSFAPETSVMKKKVMQKVASEYHVDDPVLHWRSFRLS